MTELDQFRQQTREWLEQHCPQEMRTRATQDELYWGGRNAQFVSSAQQSWFESMRDRGWLAPEWPEQYGGGGLSSEEHAILKEEMASLNCRPPLVGMGLWMIGPTILHFGTEEQKRRYLIPIAKGEIRWCQGYSEPNAGSDLASLQCRGEVKGDHMVINGSKIWTSMAKDSDWIFALIRTNPAAGTKHEGISFVLMDLKNPGITVEPITLLNGNADFCQTFFDDAQVSLDHVLGEVDQGWSVAKYLLVFERMAMGELESSFASPKPALKDLAQQYLDSQDPAYSYLRNQVSASVMNNHAVNLTSARVEEEFAHSEAGAMNTAGIMKYIKTEDEKAKLQLSAELMGCRGFGWKDSAFSEIEQQAASDWLNVYGLTIAGGTTEIQLNVIAKRTLGLPD